MSGTSSQGEPKKKARGGSAVHVAVLEFWSHLDLLFEMEMEMKGGNAFWH